MEQPLIYTSKGNLPIDSLTLSTQWEITDSYVKLVEKYTDESGEVVRESAHVRLLKGLDFDGTTGRIG